MLENAANPVASYDSQEGTEVGNNVDKEPKAYSADRNSVVPSDRDFQEYMPGKLPFCYPDRAAKEGEYPYEVFTHQAYCTLVNANRMSVMRALGQEDERKRLASRDAIKAEIKHLPTLLGLRTFPLLPIWLSSYRILRSPTSFPSGTYVKVLFSFLSVRSFLPDARVEMLLHLWRPTLQP